MDISDAFVFFARFIWPPLLAWNIYLHREIQKSNADIQKGKDAIGALRLHVAENYAGKKDLEKMFSDFEQRIDKRIDQLVKTLCATK
ncbi:hypothetical protein [Desulfovibrio psychrotolerans]|uniref:Uncharacterized protein n=1 Tax=Desulfovibrio psychrotolerans TaxID=415242 RepID=A0A7J0BX36_9BACT|nr:hypothetical protein [Desulfovibrio psychrotolerans]GFM37732.1 hypothetical protein DSM19430T_24160 [Desulfovibrio psychrotolerans]